MRLSTGDFKDALRRKRQAAGESSRAAKRGRGRGQAEPAPAVEEAVAPAAVERPAEELATEVPAEEAVPEPARAEEGEITATTEAEVVVVDLEADDQPGEPGAGEAVRVHRPSAIVQPKAEKAPAEVREEPPAVKSADKGPEGRKEPERRRREPEGSSRPPTQRPARPRVDGPQEKAARPGPRLVTMGDASQAATLLAQLLTPESAEEVRGLSTSGTLDMLMVSFVQAANGVMGLREVLSRNAGALSKALDRANKYKRESAEQAQSLARLIIESQAREVKLGNEKKEAERRAAEAGTRAISTEAKLYSASVRIKNMGLRSEEQDRHVQELQLQLAAAKLEIRAETEKVAAAEKAAAEAKAEVEKAAALVEEANARAAEVESRAQRAEQRVEDAETKARQAEAGTEKAIEDFKSSPKFKEEVIEASLDAYVKGFESCKAKVSQVLKIGDSDLEKIQPDESDEDQDEEVGGGGAEEDNS